MVKTVKTLSIRTYSLLWATRSLSVDIAIAFFAYTTFYVTDILGMPPATIGVILIVSKILDGLVDFFYGYLVDRTKTRLGTGRPYELALIGYWASGILIFATPHTTIGLMLFYFFIMYNLRISVFLSLLQCSEPTYFSNSIPDKSKAPTILTVRGMICGLGTLPLSILLPQAVAWAGSDQIKWVSIGLVLAGPFLILGLMRFFFIKEVNRPVSSGNDGYSFKEAFGILKKNKYIWIYAATIFMTYMSYHITSESGLFYAKYVLGDIGAATWLTMAGMSAIVSTLFIPYCSKKMGLTGYVKLLFLSNTV